MISTGSRDRGARVGRRVCDHVIMPGAMITGELLAWVGVGVVSLWACWAGAGGARGGSGCCSQGLSARLRTALQVIHAYERRACCLFWLAGPEGFVRFHQMRGAVVCPAGLPTPGAMSAMKFKSLCTALGPAALAAAITLVGCSTDNSGSGRGDSSSPPGASSGAIAVDQHNDADVIFVQTMIPHHEQAVDMTVMLLGKSGVNPEVEALAKQIKAAQQPEIEMMNAWLEAWGRIQMSEGPHHSGEGGIMTEEKMQELDEANGPDGQRLYLEGMIRHHRGAITTAQTEINSGDHPDAITLAKDIADSQQGEVDAMRELLNKI